MASEASSYQALILDFGGVLTSPLMEAMDRFGREVGIELQDLARAALGPYMGVDDSLVTDFESGRIGEDEFSRAFSARLEQLSGRRVEPEGIVTRLFDVQIEEEMLAAVEIVRAAGLKTGVLSNTWGAGMYPRARLEGFFDEVILSNEVGLRKPDPAIFRLALERLDVEAALAVFVDDHPGHLEPAGDLGMKTVLHVTPAETLQELEELLGRSLRR
ncbi:MAG: HAD family hydrolase [Actinomycetota bacterium]